LAAVPSKIRKLQPLRPAVFHILLVLSEGDRHGYAIKQEVELRTGGVVNMGPGTLYESIQRMLEKGLIEETSSGRRPEEDRSQRRYYHLTEFGTTVLHAEVSRLDEVVRYARSSLEGSRPA
jgi:DNA-binding PadR family transcriptional regulator